jgi:hypothetical protein
MLSVTNVNFMLKVIMLSIVILIIVTLTAVLLSGVMLSVIIPGIIMPRVVMLNAMAPRKCTIMQPEPSQVKVTVTFAKFAAKNTLSKFFHWLP